MRKHVCSCIDRHKIDKIYRQTDFCRRLRTKIQIFPTPSCDPSGRRIAWWGWATILWPSMATWSGGTVGIEEETELNQLDLCWVYLKMGDLANHLWPFLEGQRDLNHETWALSQDFQTNSGHKQVLYNLLACQEQNERERSLSTFKRHSGGCGWGASEHLWSYRDVRCVSHIKTMCFHIAEILLNIPQSVHHDSSIP